MAKTEAYPTPESPAMISMHRHASGNVTIDDHGDTLVYDAWNRLVAVKNSSGDLIAGYTYDGLGRMTSETIGTTTTDFYYNGNQIIEERTGVTTATGSSTGSSGSVTEELVYSPDYVNDVLLRDTYSGGSFSSRVYFTHDANYDVTSVISSGGSVDQRMTYDAYGNVTFLTSSWATTTDSYAVENLWQGGWRDAVTRYYHFQNRWYSPSMQWLSWGPANYPDGPSGYLPMDDNPINNVDPKGLAGEQISAKDLAGIVYGETANIYPQLKAGVTAGKNENPDNWDPDSSAQLTQARILVAIVTLNGGSSTAKPSIPTTEQLKNPLVQAVWQSAEDAAGIANDILAGKGLFNGKPLPDADLQNLKKCNKFFFWISTDGKVPTNRSKGVAAWPFTETDKIFAKFGPFRKTQTAGDVPAGNNIYVFIYKGVK